VQEHLLTLPPRYELPQRVLDATVYPAKAANGSTVLLYGHETGVGILWRGGRPLKKAAASSKQQAKPQKVNGTNDAIMIIDSDDDGPANAASAPSMPEAEFEDDEEELDPDQPYPSIVQHINLSLNSQVLHIAVPQIPAASALRSAGSMPPIFSTKMVFTVTCADSTVRIITAPLNPPPNSAKEKPLSAKSQFGEEIVKFHAHQSIARGVAMTWTSKGDPGSKYENDNDMDMDEDEDTAGATPSRGRRRQQDLSHSRPRTAEGFELLVATHSAELGGLVKIWRFGLTETAVDGAHPIMSYKTLTLQKPASRIAFNSAQYPNRRHSQLLIADVSGTARIYDPFAPVRRRSASGTQSEPGAFIATLRSTFEGTKSSQYIPAVLATRKPIIDAAWTSGGHHVLALLADGEWGVWDVDRSGPNPPKDPSAFSLRGFVGTAEKEGSTGGVSSPKRAGRSSLAPMTPNTRRRKEDHLFQGNSANLSVPTSGGVSVASLPSTSGAAPEDSVIIWYGSEVHRISDLAKFWARTASASSGQSLPGPGLTQLNDIVLLGESITSITQFDTTQAASRMAIGRDTLISAEHRLIITSNTNQPLGRDLGTLFTTGRVEDEDTRKADQALLSHGELDLGGMDRLLDDMESSGSGLKSLTKGNNPRRVLFASSGA
jgi:hypothetical protein